MRLTRMGVPAPLRPFATHEPDDSEAVARPLAWTSAPWPGRARRSKSELAALRRALSVFSA